MKSISILNYILISSMFFFSCEKDKNYSGGTSNSNNNNSQIGTFSGVFGEKTISTNEVKVDLTDNFLEIHAYSGSDTVTLFASGFQEGVYTVPNDADIEYLTSTHSYSAYDSPSQDAIISINEYNDSTQTISGTYSGTLLGYNATSSSSIIVKDGVFEDLKLDHNNNDGGGDGGDTNQVLQTYISAVIDGQLITFDSCIYVIDSGNATGNPYEYTHIAAADEYGNPVELKISINDQIQENTTYTRVEGGIYEFSAYYPPRFSAYSGSVTITSIDPSSNTISGTFSFDADIQGAPPEYNQHSYFRQGQFTAILAQ